MHHQQRPWDCSTPSNSCNTNKAAVVAFYVAYIVVMLCNLVLFCVHLEIVQNDDTVYDKVHHTLQKAVCGGMLVFVPVTLLAKAKENCLLDFSHGFLILAVYNLVCLAWYTYDFFASYKNTRTRNRILIGHTVHGVLTSANTFVLGYQGQLEVPHQVVLFLSSAVLATSVTCMVLASSDTCCNKTQSKNVQCSQQSSIRIRSARSMVAANHHQHTPNRSARVPRTVSQRFHGANLETTPNVTATAPATRSVASDGGVADTDPLPMLPTIVRS